MEDILLQKFFEKNRWESAIQTGVDKEMDMSMLRELSSPEGRIDLYHAIRDGRYVIQPPHEAQIPKDDGTFRTVYVNKGIDRVVLSIINDMLFELYPEMIHPSCKSYQKGLGCGKTVQTVSKIIHDSATQEIGIKVDLSKYFDSVPIEYIDEVFARIEDKYGSSKIIDITRKYYHTNTVIDINKNLIEKYSSLRQGCAVAAFLADAVLYDIDDTISKLPGVYYVRYSDDILIIGQNWKTGYDILQKMLKEKSLILNPKKVETLYKDKWFKFLGFNIKGNQITLSKSRTKSFQKEIEKRTVNGASHDLQQVIKSVERYLYVGDGEYSWATSVLPIINVQKDIQTLNAFVMDAIRASVTGKHRIGGLGSDMNNPEFTIMRGLGAHVKSNRQKIPNLTGYMTISCMKNAMMTSKPVYETLVRTL